jgi:hypothetical protein
MERKSVWNMPQVWPAVVTEHTRYLLLCMALLAATSVRVSNQTETIIMK